MKHYLLLISLFCISCSTIRPSVSKTSDTFKNKAISVADYSKAVDELTRGDVQRYNFFILFYLDKLELNVTLFTPELLKTSLNIKAEEMAFKNNWSEIEKQSYIQNQIKLNNTLDETCFRFEIRATNEEAKNSHYWQANVIQDGKTMPVKFMGFAGTVTTKYSLYSDQNSAHLNEDKTYNLNGVACGEKIKYDKPFSMVIEPRYAKGIDPITLVWE